MRYRSVGDKPGIYQPPDCPTVGAVDARRLAHAGQLPKQLLIARGWHGGAAVASSKRCHPLSVAGSAVASTKWVFHGLSGFVECLIAAKSVAFGCITFTAMIASLCEVDSTISCLIRPSGAR